MLDDAPFTAEVRRVADGFDIRSRAAKARVRVLTPRLAELFARLPEKVAADTSKLILSPMPGLVVAIAVDVGQEVKTGETVAIIEAMKMQNILKAERDGVVKAVVRQGRRPGRGGRCAGGVRVTFPIPTPAAWRDLEGGSASVILSGRCWAIQSRWGGHWRGCAGRGERGLWVRCRAAGERPTFTVA